MSTTPRMYFPEIAASQSQKEVTHNEALQMLDAFMFCAVEDKDAVNPPSTSDGICYIVAAGGASTWTGQDNNIAQRYNSGWTYYTPSEGWRAWVKDEVSFYVFTSSSWTIYSAGSTGTTVYAGTGITVSSCQEVALDERNANIVIIPEYAGAIITASSTQTDPGGSTYGMFSDSELVSNTRYNYYQWWSSVTSEIQSYNIALQVPLPYNFTGFQTGVSNSLVINFKTEENTTGNNMLDVQLQKDGTTSVSSYTTQVSSTAATWNSLGIDETDTVLAACTAGDIIDIKATLYSMSEKYTRLGKINLAVKLQ